MKSIFSISKRWRILTALKCTGVIITCIHVCVCSVLYNSLRHQRLGSARLLCPWDFSGKKMSELPFPTPGDLPDPGIEITSPASLLRQKDSSSLRHLASQLLLKIYNATNTIWLNLQGLYISRMQTIKLYLYFRLQHLQNDKWKFKWLKVTVHGHNLCRILYIP